MNTPFIYVILALWKGRCTVLVNTIYTWFLVWPCDRMSGEHDAWISIWCLAIEGRIGQHPAASVNIAQPIPNRQTLDSNLNSIVSIPGCILPVIVYYTFVLFNGHCVLCLYMAQPTGLTE